MVLYFVKGLISYSQQFLRTLKLYQTRIRRRINFVWRNGSEIFGGFLQEWAASSSANHGVLLSFVVVRESKNAGLELILRSLWRTRESGLNAAEKAHLQDLLQLPSHKEVDPVSSYLRIRWRSILQLTLSSMMIFRYVQSLLCFYHHNPKMILIFG